MTRLLVDVVTYNNDERDRDEIIKQVESRLKSITNEQALAALNEGRPDDVAEVVAVIDSQSNLYPVGSSRRDESFDFHK